MKSSRSNLRFNIHGSLLKHHCCILGFFRDTSFKPINDLIPALLLNQEKGNYLERGLHPLSYTVPLPIIGGTGLRACEPTSLTLMDVLVFISNN